MFKDRVDTQLFNFRVRYRCFEGYFRDWAAEIQIHVEAEFQCEHIQTRGTRIKLSDKFPFHTIQRFAINMKSGRNDSN